MASITIEGKVFGQKRPLFRDWAIPLEPDAGTGGERLTLRAFIARVVLEEVQAFKERQEHRRLVQALTQADIARGLMLGKVDMGGRDLLQEVDPQAAVDAALLAFEDGLYFVFVDEEQQTDLDREIFLRPDSKVTFLRLVALAGG
ncbi:MAG TPA: hypothetical protein VKT32_05110 [Chthonomonadaceae bacterium]|nr:hypothetical protein [Chthonomonadaceae bacterium]